MYEFGMDFEDINACDAFESRDVDDIAVFSCFKNALVAGVSGMAAFWGYNVEYGNIERGFLGRWTYGPIVDAAAPVALYGGGFLSLYTGAGALGEIFEKKK